MMHGPAASVFRAPIFQLSHELVLFIHQNRSRLDGPVRQREPHDDDLFADSNQVSACAVHANGARLLHGNGVGFEASAGRIAYDQNAFSRPKTNHLHEILVDRNTSDIRQLRLGNGRLMNL